MSRPLLILLTLVFSFLGIGDSWYLYQSAVMHTALSCDLGAGLDGCNVVAQSAYSHLFGTPLALYGVGFFAVVFVLAALISVFPMRRSYHALYLLASAGALASVVFLFIQFVLIRAICIYCIASAVMTFVLVALARSLWKKHASPPSVLA